MGVVQFDFIAVVHFVSLALCKFAFNYDVAYHPLNPAHIFNFNTTRLLR